MIKLKSLKTRITSNTISSRPYQAFKIHYREGESGQAFIMVYIYVCKKFKVTCEMIGGRDGDWVNNLLQTYCKVRRIFFNRCNQPQTQLDKTCDTIFWQARNPYRQKSPNLVDGCNVSVYWIKYRYISHKRCNTY